MKVSVKLNDRVTVEGEGETQLDVFRNLASMQEVFGESSCQKCNSSNLQFVVRRVQDGKKEYEYPELRCKGDKCYAKLSFGTMEGGQLFPVRHERKDGEYLKDENGKNIPRGKNGWVRWNFDTKKEE